MLNTDFDHTNYVRLDKHEKETARPSLPHPTDPYPVRSPWWAGNVPPTSVVNPDAIGNFYAPGIPMFRITPAIPLTMAGSGVNSALPSPTVPAVTPQPPAPAISQSLTATSTGFSFSFLQIRTPMNVPSTAVISSYKVYRSGTNAISTATVFKVIHHNPANQNGTVTIQDVQPVGTVQFYWVSAVNVSGVESTATPAQSGSVTSGSQLTSSGQLVNADAIAADGSTFGRITLVQRNNALDSQGNLILKNKVNTAATTVGPTTNSVGFVTIPDMSSSVTTKGNPVLITFSGAFIINGVTGTNVVTGIFVVARDTTTLSTRAYRTIQAADTNEKFSISLTWIDTPTAGSHTYTAEWLIDNNPSGVTLQGIGTDRAIQVIELG